MADEQVDTIWLTQEAFDAASAELEHLKGAGRAAVSAKIARARDEGDLSENAGYHAAREEQGQQELRIRQLEFMLRHAEVGETPVGDADQVSPGCKVTIYYDDDPDDTDTFLLGSREVLATDDSVEHSVYSPQSPLGSAVLGAKVGEEVRYTAPNGKELMVVIIKVENL